MIDLADVLETFVWMMVLTSIGIFVITAIRFLPTIGIETTDTIFERMRFIAMLLPILYIFLNIGESANDISDILFDGLLPLVLVIIFAFGLLELVMPFLSQVKRYTSRETQSIMNKGRNNR